MKEKQCQTCNFTSDYENHFRGVFCVDCSLGEIARLTEENNKLKLKLKVKKTEISDELYMLIKRAISEALYTIYGHGDDKDYQLYERLKEEAAAHYLTDAEFCQKVNNVCQHLILTVTREAVDAG